MCGSRVDRRQDRHIWLGYSDREGTPQIRVNGKLTTALRRVDLDADLNARESDGYCWSLLSDASDPALIVPGAIIVAGEADTPALVEVVDLQDIGHDTIVRFRILPGVVEDYEDSLARSRISA